MKMKKLNQLKTVSFINEDGKEVIILDFNSLTEKYKKKIDKFFDTYCSLEL